MICVGTELVNKVNGLRAVVKDMTRNGIYVLSSESVHLGFSNICENPFMSTEDIKVESNLLNKYIRDKVWEALK